MHSLTTALDAGEWSALRPSRFTHKERISDTQSRSRRGGEEKNYQLTPGIEPRLSDRPARSQSLYRLRYPGSFSAMEKRKSKFKGKVTPVL
jgi:hypothetical protein